MMDISENEIKDAVAYKKYLTEQHSHTSGTVVSLFCTVNLPYKKYLTEQHSHTSGTVVSLFCTVNLPYKSI